MKYLCLVYGEEKKLQALATAESAALTRTSIEYDRRLQARGRLIVAEALAPTLLSRTVQVRDGKTVTIDGPFAETKEQLLGFILIDAADEQDALDIAAGIPLAKLGTVEVRRIQSVE
jgi:hypothetical protein